MADDEHSCSPLGFADTAAIFKRPTETGWSLTKASVALHRPCPNGRADRGALAKLIAGG
jgi:hypothetical protein